MIMRAPRGNTIMAIGDSISVNGHTVPGLGAVHGVVNRIGGPEDGIAEARGYLFWSSLFSQGKLHFAGVAATGGYTTAEVVAHHLPTVLSLRPALCVVLAGTNDARTGTPLVTWAAQMTSIYTSLLEAGVLPIACTLPPAQDLNGVNIQLTSYNGWINRNAVQTGLPLVDFHSLLVEDRGSFAEGMSDDGVHPSTAGAQAMGRLLWDELASIIPPFEPWFSHDQPTRDETRKFVNSLFLDDADGDGVPDLWTTEGSPITTLAPDRATFGLHSGNVWSLTPDTSDIYANSASVGRFEPGSTLWFALKFQTSGVQAAGGGIDIRLASTDLRCDLYSMVNYATQDLGSNPVYVMAGQMQMPSGFAGNKLAVRLGVRRGGTLKVAQPTLIDFTAAELVDL